MSGKTAAGAAGGKLPSGAAPQGQSAGPFDPKKRPPKGHRQKGAGTVVVSKGEVKRDGLEIKELQQTPKQLLLNYCKAEKRPQPKYVSAGGAPSGKFLVRVILPDPKDQRDKDIMMVPKDASFESQVEAEHAAALLALHKVDGARSHEMKLPEPYRTAWLKLTGRSAPSSTAAAAPDTADEFSCEECGKGFSKAHALEHHKKTAHPKPKKVNTDGAPLNESGGASTKDVVAPVKEGFATKDNAKDPIPAPSPSPSPSPPVATEAAKAEKKEKPALELQSRSEFATEHERQAFFEKQRINRERRERQRRMAENDDEDLVFMSEENRAAIEAIVREAASIKNDDSGNGDDNDIDDMDLRIHHAKPLIDALVKKMGFKRSDARLAVINGATNIDSAMDWLLVHLPEDSLPAGLDPRGMQLEVTTSATAIASQQPKTSNNNRSSPVEIPAESTPNVELFAWYRAQFGDEFSLVSSSEPTSEDQEWKSEWEALESIFSTSEVRLVEDSSEASNTKRFVLKLEGNPQLGKGCSLDFRFDPWTYPFQALPIVFVSGIVSPSLAFAATRALAEKLKTLKGEPSAYAIWDFASQMEVSTAAPSSKTTRVQNEDKQDEACEEGQEETRAMRSSSKRKGDSARQIVISKEEREKQCDLLLRHLERQRKPGAEGYAQQQKRHELPAFKFRNEIVNAVRSNRVVIIKGETGCGKTTQVPQFIFEDYVEQRRGGYASLIITQPRRLAAVSVATRVAFEFGEDVGNTVGYRVQLESKAHPVKTRMEFVTTGLLLRRMQSDTSLKDVTHILVDEVHERSLDSDFLLALLRETLKKNTQLKIVLMSATMDAGRFAAYFGGAPVLEIPGRTFPVDDYYLEDVLQQVKYVPPQNVPNKVAEDVIGYLERDVDYRFLAMCVDHCHSQISDHGEGSILVFLSGVAEISKAIRACESLDESKELYLLPLHGALTGPDQRRVFDRAPKGKRKVIMSTNVAETSVTIDDVVCVIDTGRMKEMRFDAISKMSSLVDTWVSAASARQRRGRAGRVRKGICWKLFSRTKKLDADQLAEVHRVPLEQCVLQVASMGTETVGDLSLFFDSLVEPPNRMSVVAAIEELVSIGALEMVSNTDSNNSSTFVAALTALGSHLAKLPMDARLGKMLLFGSLLGVPEEVAVVAAGMSRRSPFLNPPPERREEAKSARKSLAAVGIANAAQSDHLILVAAFQTWKGFGSDKERRKFAMDHFLLDEALRDVDKLRREFLGALEHIGFPFVNEVIRSNHPLLDLNAKKRRLVKASLCAGLFPNVVKIKRPSKRYVETLGGAMEAQASARELSFELLGIDRQQQQQGGDNAQQLATKHGRVFLHPSSINFESNAFNSSWMVFSDLVHTSKPFVRDCTVVAPYGLLLFGGTLEVKHEEAVIVVGGALRFKVAPRIAVLVKEVRKLLDKSLMDKIANPGMNVTKCRVLEACKRLVEGDGFF